MSGAPRERLVLGLIIALGSLLLGGAALLYWLERAPAGTRAAIASPAAAAHPTHELPAADIYTCPMHPQIVEEGPGACPICGMDLVKQRAPQAVSADPAGAEARSAAAAVTIDPVVVQNMGVRVARVERGPIFRHIRTVGEVDVAESEVSVVNLRYSGWIERIHVDETGASVRRGQALFDIYSPELVAAQEEYLLALRTGGAGSPLARSAQQRLEFWDLGAQQLDELRERGKALRTVKVRAPQPGYVLHKNVVQGARVQAGADLYRIGNLDKIWVNAEVYEFDAPWVELGAPASMELSFQRGERFAGKVAYIYPTLNPRTRTLTVRLEFDNPGLALKPGMFATVQIEAQRKDAVVLVPTEAILRSGTRQLVFVTEVLGRYQPREISTGLTGDHYVTEVLDGLEPGEQVVTSGQFLLDSESQLQEAVNKLLAARLQVHAAGAAPAADDAHAAHEHGETYFTCPMHPQIVQDEAGACPICGMDLVEKKR